MEGFVDAMVLVEGLKRAGSGLTREKYIEAIEGMNNLDMGLGSLKLEFTPQSARGSTRCTGPWSGTAETFTDWSNVKQ